ncbi:MAG TPA: excinuclease ABC subunit UvrC, partial [Candidatus Lokiarchaeia archaeon]|nr:excinuclease ABC subunit UvrC [Candidatus Lokiarchaeia archaeon]
NVRLKDDKSFPFIMVTTGETFPRVKIIRGPHLYPQEYTFFGPYVDKKSAVRTLKVVRRLFPFCTHKKPCKKQERPCIYSQLGLCPAPCAGLISPEDYMVNIRRLMRFLEGDSAAVLADLKVEMEAASQSLQFEQAAAARDKIAALEKTLGPQDVLTAEQVNKDILAVQEEGAQAAILVLFIRKGRVLGKKPYILDLDDKIPEGNEILPVFMEQYYTQKATFIPDQVIVEQLTEQITRVKDLLAEIHPKFDVAEPAPGSRDEGLLKIAKKNIALILGQRQLLAEKGAAKLAEIYADLEGKVPHLERPPAHLEAFDISNTQGTNPTASMVVFRDGAPAPQEYRHFRIRVKETPDDFAMMNEVVTRRYSRLLREKAEMPDLILVDGGKGQLSAAMEALDRLGLADLPIVGLAKQFEEVYVTGQSDPIDLPPDTVASRTFQAIRDEAHRFAINYHRLLRQKHATESELDAIPGLGPKRKKLLIAAFGSVDAIKKASFDELATVLPATLARAAFNALSHASPKEKKKFKVRLPKPSGNGES